MHEIWGDMKGAIDNVLDTITLEDMRIRNAELNENDGYEYII